MSEIDFEKKVWTVPSDRMKAGGEHRVPLSGHAVAILRELQKANAGPVVFAGQSRNEATHRSLYGSPVGIGNDSL